VTYLLVATVLCMLRFWHSVHGLLLLLALVASELVTWLPHASDLLIRNGSLHVLNTYGYIAPASRARLFKGINCHRNPVGFSITTSHSKIFG